MRTNSSFSTLIACSKYQIPFYQPLRGSFPSNPSFKDVMLLVLNWPWWCVSTTKSSKYYTLKVSFFSFKISLLDAAEIHLRLRTLVLPQTHMVAHNCPQLQFQGIQWSLLTSSSTRFTCDTQ